MPRAAADPARHRRPRRAAGPRPSSPAGSGRRAPFHSTVRACRPEKSATKPEPHGASEVSRLSVAEPNCDVEILRAAAVGVEAPERRGARARHQRDEVARPVDRLLDRGRGLADRADGERVAAVEGAHERRGPQQRRHDLDHARPRQQHLDLAEAVLGQRDAAPHRAGALAARDLAVLERAGVAGLRQPGDVGGAGAVDGDARVVPAAQEPRRRRGLGRSRQADQQRARSDPQRSHGAKATRAAGGTARGACRSGRAAPAVGSTTTPSPGCPTQLPSPAASP